MPNPKKSTPCDVEPFICPYDVESGEGCRYWCGLGVDEDEPDNEEEEFYKDLRLEQQEQM